MTIDVREIILAGGVTVQSRQSRQIIQVRGSFIKDIRSKGKGGV